MVHFPGAFDRYGLAALAGVVGERRLLAVTEAEALSFCCNAIPVGRRIVMPGNCPGIGDLLHQRGYQIFPCDLSEFLKSGGAARCLVCRLG